MTQSKKNTLKTKKKENVAWYPGNYAYLLTCFRFNSYKSTKKKKRKLREK